MGISDLNRQEKWEKREANWQMGGFAGQGGEGVSGGGGDADRVKVLVHSALAVHNQYSGVAVGTASSGASPC